MDAFVLRCISLALVLMGTPMIQYIPLASCSCPQSLPVIWTACRRWCRLVCVWCRLPPVCRPAPPQPGVFTFLPVAAVRWPPSHSPALSHIRTRELPATRRDNQTAYILHILSTDATTLCISISAARAWAGGEQVYRGHSPGQHRSALMSPAVAGPGWRRRHTLAHRYRRCPGPGTQSPASLATRQSHTAIQ